MSSVLSPLRKLLQAKERETLEQAELKITNDAANNEQQIIKELRSVNFHHQNVPETERKLEKDFPDLAQQLERTPLSIEQDTSEFYKNLLALAQRYSLALESGYEQTARFSRMALVRGINDIRSRMPTLKAEYAELYIKRAAHYLEEWLTAVEVAFEYDREGQYLVIQKSDYDRSCGELKQLQDDLTDQLLQPDTDYSIALGRMLDNDGQEDRQQWTEAQWKLHHILVELAMKSASLKLQSVKLHQTEDSHSARKHMLDTLRTKLSDVHLEIDPEIEKKEQKIFEEMFNELEKQSEDIYAMLTLLENHDTRMEEISNGGGMNAANNAVKKEMDQIMNHSVSNETQIALTENQNV